MRVPNSDAANRGQMHMEARELFPFHLYDLTNSCVLLPTFNAANSIIPNVA
jgi:hypothetical protein